MEFATFHFFLFFPVAVILYYLLPQRFRWILLLLASALFYCAFSWKYLGLLLFAAGFNYLVALNINRGKGVPGRIIYVAGLTGNLFLLCFFKYVNYWGIDFDNLAQILHLTYPPGVTGVLFPLGLSYFVFTSIAYLIDVKNGDIPAERHAGIFTAYLLFFPKVVQGPIERAGNILPQFHRDHAFLHGNIRQGLALMVWGFFKKLVIADNLAPFVGLIFSGKSSAGGPATAAGVLVFGIQLYADFSGYTDIALGSAKVLGFDLVQNFKRPFRAHSVRDFWSRWHISLSSWCSDYIFLPVLATSYNVKRYLGRYSLLKWLSAEKIMYTAGSYLTFLIIGAWHGVGWNYIIVGLLFGSYVSLDVLTYNLRKRLYGKRLSESRPGLNRFLDIFITMVLVNVVWIFFRTGTPAQAMNILHNLFDNWTLSGLMKSIELMAASGLDGRQLAAGTAGMILLLATEFLPENTDCTARILAAPGYIRWSMYYLFIAIIILYCAGETRQFIYLQF